MVGAAKLRGEDLTDPRAPQSSGRFFRGPHGRFRQEGANDNQGNRRNQTGNQRIPPRSVRIGDRAKRRKEAGQLNRGKRLGVFIANTVDRGDQQSAER